MPHSPRPKPLAPCAIAEAVTRWGSDGQPVRPGAQASALGARTVGEGEEVRLATVYDGGPAQQAGLSAGDTLVAIDGLRVTAGNLDTLLGRRQPGQIAKIHAFRRDELMRFNLTLGDHDDETPYFSCDKAANKLRRGWLGG